MSMKKARKRVARGAALLDAQRPGWRQLIKLDDLSLSSCTNCVIGQVFGPEYELQDDAYKREPFSYGIDVLGLDDDEGVADYVVVEKHGFDTDTYGDVTYNELNRAWRELLETAA